MVKNVICAQLLSLSRFCSCPDVISARMLTRRSQCPNAIHAQMLKFKKVHHVQIFSHAEMLSTQRCCSCPQPDVVHAHVLSIHRCCPCPDAPKSKKANSPRCCPTPDVVHAQILSTSRCCPDIKEQKGHHTDMLSMSRCLRAKRLPCPNIIHIRYCQCPTLELILCKFYIF